jgi:hypothetical protein
MRDLLSVRLRFCTPLVAFVVEDYVHAVQLAQAASQPADACAACVACMVASCCQLCLGPCALGSLSCERQRCVARDTSLSRW